MPETAMVRRLGKFRCQFAAGLHLAPKIPLPSGSEKSDHVVDMPMIFGVLWDAFGG
jgi:hypothetical protein